MIRNLGTEYLHPTALTCRCLCTLDTDPDKSQGHEIQTVGRFREPYRHRRIAGMTQVFGSSSFVLSTVAIMVGLVDHAFFAQVAFVCHHESVSTAHLAIAAVWNLVLWIVSAHGASIAGNVNACFEDTAGRDESVIRVIARLFAIAAARRALYL